MAINQATTADLQARSLRPLTSAELQWGMVRLRDAFTQILITVPAIEARLDAGVISNPINQLVIQTQCAMVLRVLSNPDGVLEETIDDYTRRLDATVSSGGLALTAVEQAMLVDSLTGAGSTRGAFTIRPTRQRSSAAW